jgi:hypothetical protein
MFVVRCSPDMLRRAHQPGDPAMLYCHKPCTTEQEWREWRAFSAISSTNSVLARNREERDCSKRFPNIIDIFTLE